MSYSIQDLRDWAAMLRGLATKWPDDARGHDLEQLCGKAGLYVSDAWHKGFFNRAAWVELRDWLYEPDRVTGFDFYCRSVEFLWWGWDNGRWTKDAGWPDSPADQPEKADMRRLTNSRDIRLSFQSNDGKLSIDSGPPPTKGPPASVRVLHHGCIVWATIFEREAIAVSQLRQHERGGVSAGDRLRAPGNTQVKREREHKEGSDRVSRAIQTVGRVPAPTSTQHPTTNKAVLVVDGAPPQPPALTKAERLTLCTLSSFDPSILASASDVAGAMPMANRLSERTIRPAISRLVTLGFAERPNGDKQGVRLTIPGRRLASKIAD